jgi:DNA-binding NtrC family response regulator
LKNVIERGVILCRQNALVPEHLPIELYEGEEPSPVPKVSMGNVSLQEMEKHHILDVLKSVNGNKSQAARILDISRSTLREKLKNYQLT